MRKDETSIAEDGTHLSPLAKKIIVIFSSVHGLILLISILPIDVPPHSSLLSMLQPYQELTGAKQDWNMFNTIPFAYSLSVKMKVEYPDGHIEERGAVLPEMKLIRFPRDKRYYYAVQRIMFAEMNLKYRDGWQQQIAERIEREGARSFEVEVETQAIRHLFHIAKDRKLSKTLSDRFGTYGVFREH